MKFSVRVCAAIALAIVLLVSVALSTRQKNPALEGRLISEWAEDLLSSDYKIRGEAEIVLRNAGEAAVPQLRRLLRRRNGAWEQPLVKMTELLPFIKYRVVDANLCRARAAEMLGSFGRKAEPAVPDLVATLAYEQSAAESARALLRIGGVSIEFVERGLNSRDAKIRERCARLLPEFSPVRKGSIKLLIAATRDGYPSVRKEAARSLGEMLSPSRDAAIREMRTHALPALLQLAGDENLNVRAAALAATGEIGDATAQVLRALKEGMQDAEPVVQLQAAKACWVLDQDAAEFVPTLTRILGTSERWQAAYALGEIGSGAAAAVPALAKLLAEEQVPRPFRTPPSAAFALGKIGARAVPAVLVLLENADARVRMNALMAFGFMGTEGREAVPHLIKHLEDENLDVRHTTALTLAQIGAESERILAGLSDCLSAEDIYMRSAAAAVLRQIAPEGNWQVESE